MAKKKTADFLAFLFYFRKPIFLELKPLELLFPFYFINIIKNKALKRLPNPEPIFVLLVVTVTISSAHYLNTGSTLTLLEPAKYIISATAAYGFFNFLTYRKISITALGDRLVVIGALISFISLVAFYFPDLPLASHLVDQKEFNWKQDRVIGLDLNPNYFAVYLLFVSSLSIANMFFRKTVLSMLLAGLIFLALFHTFSRGALLVYLFQILLAVSFIVSFKRFRLFLVIFITGACLLYLLSTIGALSSFTERFVQSSREGSGEIRFAIWSVLADLITNNPIVGIGYGNSREVVASVIGSSLGPHNEYLKQMVSGGLFGVFAFLLFFISLVVGSWRSYRKVASAMNAGLFIYFASMMLWFFINTGFTSRVLWLAISVYWANGLLIDTTEREEVSNRSHDR